MGHSGSVYSGKWYIVSMRKVIYFREVFLAFVFILLIYTLFSLCAYCGTFNTFTSLKSPPNFTFISVVMIFLFSFIPKFHWLIFHSFLLSWYLFSKLLYFGLRPLLQRDDGFIGLPLLSFHSLQNIFPKFFSAPQELLSGEIFTFHLFFCSSS